MNWEKLKSNHYFEKPVPHIYTSTIFDIKEYDKLYENQNNLNHKTWRDFKEKYKTDFQFLSNLTEIDKKREVIALWFFPERSDRGATPTLVLENKKIKYFINSFLLTTCNNLKINELDEKYIRYPLVQLKMSLSTYNKIIERLHEPR